MPSTEALARCPSSGLNTRSQTTSEWPSRTAVRRAADTSQTAIRPSEWPSTRMSPSRLRAVHPIRPACRRPASARPSGSSSSIAPSSAPTAIVRCAETATAERPVPSGVLVGGGSAGRLRRTPRRGSCRWVAARCTRAGDASAVARVRVGSVHATRRGALRSSEEKPLVSGWCPRQDSNLRPASGGR